MKTTFREIKSYKPCIKGWNNLCERFFNFEVSSNSRIKLGDVQLDTEVTILQILELNGISDAFWALRTQKYEDYCLIMADIAESVLHFFEASYPDDNRPRLAINAIRDYRKGKITKENLNAAATAAADAADATYAAAADAAATAAADAADATYAADAAAADAADAADAAATDAAAEARRKQCKINEEILRKYLTESC